MGTAIFFANGSRYHGEFKENLNMDTESILFQTVEYMKDHSKRIAWHLLMDR